MPPREGRGNQVGDATAAASAAARQAPPVGRPLTPALPAADRRLCAHAVGRGGTAAPRSAQTKWPASVPIRGRRERADRGKETSPPTPCHTDPPAAGPAAPSAHGCPATPAERVYPGGMPKGTGGQGTAARPRPPPPPHSPPGLRAAGAPALHPPRGRGGVPPPPGGTATPGGGRSWTRTPRAPAPPAACSREGRDRRANPH